MRLIDADNLRDHFGITGDEMCRECKKDRTKCFNDKDYTLVRICAAIDGSPTVDPVKHSKWKRERHGCFILYRCLTCDELDNDKTEYCPHCGARMDGDSNAV